MMFRRLFDKGGKQMYASCNTLFEIMDDFPGILEDDGKSNAICFAIIDSMLHAIRNEDEEHLTDYRHALLRVMVFIRAQPGYETDARMTFLAGRLCGLFEVVDLALKGIVPAEVIKKIKLPKNAALIKILREQETGLDELARALVQPKEDLVDLIAELGGLVIIQRIGREQFARLSFLAQKALEKIA